MSDGLPMVVNPIYLFFSKQMSDLVTLNERRLLEEMLHFLNAYNSHCSMYVVPRLWSIFNDKLSKVRFRVVLKYFELCYLFSLLKPVPR